jgi:hypothetical protein
MVMSIVRSGASDAAMMPIMGTICASQQINLGGYVMQFEQNRRYARAGPLLIAAASALFSRPIESPVGILVSHAARSEIYVTTRAIVRTIAAHERAAA